MAKIEDHIQKAMQEGKFDNLPGKGKPLRLDDNPNDDPEWRSAHRILRNSGFSLPWIESRRDIEERLEAARKDLFTAWTWRKGALTAGKPLDTVEEDWQRALRRFKEQLAELNKRVLSYNLEVPSVQFQIPLLNVEREIAAICVDDPVR